MRARHLIVGMSAAIASASVLARDKPDPLEAADKACVDKAMTTQAMVSCSADSYQRWDKELNRAYNEVRGKLTKEGQQALKLSQQKWLAFRDAELKSIDTIYGAMDGTMFISAKSDAAASLVKARAQEMRIYAGLFIPQDQP